VAEFSRLDDPEDATISGTSSISIVTALRGAHGSHARNVSQLSIAAAKEGAPRGVIATAGFWTPESIPTCWLVYPATKCNA